PSSPLHSIVLENKGPDGPPPNTGKPIGFRHAPGEVLVKFHNDVSENRKNQYHDEADAEVMSEIPELGVYRVKSKHGQSTEALMHRYQNNPFVEFVEPNGIFHTLLTPNDPYYGLLWGLHNTGQTINGTAGKPGADIHAPEAWDIQQGNSNIIIADI